MENKRIRYTRVSKNHITNFINKIKYSLYFKYNYKSKIRTTYLYSTRCVLNKKKSNNYFSNLIKKFAITMASISLFIFMSSFLIMNMRQTSNAAILPNNKAISSSSTYNKILDEMHPEQINTNIENNLDNVLTVTSVATMENITDIFYKSITSDNTLTGDGTIGMKYDEYTI